MYEANLYIAIAYILLCISLVKFTITRQIFINIFQTEHFSSCKIC